ncbi:MAG: DUF4199 domain-containing protein [Saonia sp.]
MRKTMLRYGIYGALTISILFLLSWSVGSNLDFSTQEVLGYLSMIISLSFVFFGIKHYRDNENNGEITFGKSLKIGIAISLITALAFGILDVIYIKFINPDFLTEYYDTTIAQMKETLPADAFKVKLVEMESQKELFSSTFMSFFIMAMTVFLIGFIISLISALVLQRKSVKPGIL